MTYCQTSERDLVLRDWKRNEFMKEPQFCDNFILGDLCKLDIAVKACKDCTHVHNLAVDMVGMGFIVSNESVLSFKNTTISMNMFELEAARKNKDKNFTYASSACVYQRGKAGGPGKSWID